MVELGHVDAVVKLSPEIMSRGMEMIGQSNDEGETATAFAECLLPIFQAVTKSSLPPPKKLLFAIDADLRDEYNVIESDLLDTVLEGNVSPSDWSTAADELASRLKSDKRIGGNFHDKYQRERIADWLVRALTRAGRDDEVIAVREREARFAGSYERLVPLLIERKLYDDAERWAAEGIQKTVKEAPGIADQLAKAMADIARLRGQWSVVAAHAAREFFERPGREKFAALVAAAERAGCREAVERLALEFLKTGKLPFSVAVKKDGARSVTLLPDWPLPLSDYLLPLLRIGDPHPHYDVLIDMAIAERRPDDVLRWFDLWCAAAKGHRTGWNFGAGSYADKVAAAVAESYPERALEIYRGCIEENLPQASVSSYETVAAYLKKMRPILKSLDRGWEWNEMVTDIRVNYRNRPRFRHTTPSPCYFASAEPSLSIFVQGKKRINVGGETYLCDESSFLIYCIDVPIPSQIIEASEDVPCLSMRLRLDMPAVREVLSREDLPQPGIASERRGLAVGKNTLRIAQRRLANDRSA